MAEPIKAYCTKYVLSTGIIDEIAVVDERDGFARTRGDCRFLKWDRDVFRDRGDAVKDAGQRVKKKVASLRKQIAKLETLTF